MQLFNECVMNAKKKSVRSGENQRTNFGVQHYTTQSHFLAGQILVPKKVLRVNDQFRRFTISTG